MKSGGYLQLADMDITYRCDDGTMPDDTIFKTWERTVHAFAEISQGRFFDAEVAKKEIEDAGFVEIEVKRYKVPLSAWSSDPRYREIGRVSSIFPANPPGTGADYSRCSCMENIGRQAWKDGFWLLRRSILT
jgi:hypothetical protein